MTSPRTHPTGPEVRDNAIVRLDAALDEQQRVSEDHDAAEGSRDELRTGDQLSAANEQVAARRAWLRYVEHGY